MVEEHVHYTLQNGSVECPVPSRILCPVYQQQILQPEHKTSNRIET